MVRCSSPHGFLSTKSDGGFGLSAPWSSSTIIVHALVLVGFRTGDDNDDGDDDKCDDDGVDDGVDGDEAW
jgi:hypothetical protein